ncbi:hypothetical protein GUJ93_ZPchr0002g26237 [Zizania palustris]|uniref:Retrotransposon gag domain-containing protein n=1 Tax=Zizania palustris TaxID=103762 RepID=A0A8J5SEQ4_ZIZPA|nr:hypothetical protein GUJ93_ZPchr0002g26237 [Zizania palustris]
MSRGAGGAWLPGPGAIPLVHGLYQDGDTRTTMVPPRFYKIDFTTYNGSEDSLAWLNRCEQFFCGQRTLSSDRVWLASYHLIGAAQTWYYALEQDEGMPSWDKFKELCHMRFGPTVRIIRLSELAHLPFLSTVQEYSERFNAILCHAHDLSPVQKADLFVGGLPDQIHVDVELRQPRDLQTAMHWAHVYERRVEAISSLVAPCSTQPPQGPVPAPPRSAAPPQPAQGPAVAVLPVLPAPTLPAPARAYRRLSPQELWERRRQGLYYNCDEPYVRGHKCQRLFYIEVSDFVDEDMEEAIDLVADDATDQPDTTTCHCRHPYGGHDASPRRHPRPSSTSAPRLGLYSQLYQCRGPSSAAVAHISTSCYARSLRKRQPRLVQRSDTRRLHPHP